MLRALVVALTLIATPALAQSRAVLRGVLDAVSPDGVTWRAHSRAGEPATLTVSATTRVVAVVAADLGDIVEGAYVGVAAVPDGETGMKALEVHIFPPSMRGVGEGFRPFDLAPGSTMTNGSLTARVAATDGAKITVTYAGGAQTIRIDPSTQIVAMAPSDRSELKPGAQIVARGVSAPGGALEAAYVAVGRNGIAPPM